jgi:plasmid stabilization system protein ParE
MKYSDTASEQLSEITDHLNDDEKDEFARRLQQ